MFLKSSEPKGCAKSMNKVQSVQYGIPVSLIYWMN